MYRVRYSNTCTGPWWTSLLSRDKERSRTSKEFFDGVCVKCMYLYITNGKQHHFARLFHQVQLHGICWQRTFFGKHWTNFDCRRMILRAMLTMLLDCLHKLNTLYHFIFLAFCPTSLFFWWQKPLSLMSNQWKYLEVWLAPF